MVRIKLSDKECRDRRHLVSGNSGALLNVCDARTLFSYQNLLNRRCPKMVHSQKKAKQLGPKQLCYPSAKRTDSDAATRANSRVRFGGPPGTHLELQVRGVLRQPPEQGQVPAEALRQGRPGGAPGPPFPQLGARLQQPLAAALYQHLGDGGKGALSATSRLKLKRKRNWQQCLSPITCGMRHIKGH